MVRKPIRRRNIVSLYHVKMYILELKLNKASDYVRWWPQIDVYGVYKEFGERC